MNRKRRIPQKIKIKPIADLKIVHPHAAGLDIGASEIWACVPASSTAENVRVFGTFTVDLRALADWLVACGIDTVAMESTGVYWIPVFDLLEARGLNVYLVNSWHLKHVPGPLRESDTCGAVRPCAGLPMDPTVAQPRPVACLIPTRCRDDHAAVLPAAPCCAH